MAIQSKSAPLSLKLPLGGRPAVPYLILVLGLLFTFVVSLYLSRMGDARDQSRFRSTVRELDGSIRNRIQTYITLLRAGTGLFAASENVESKEFNNFVEQIDLRRNYPGIQGMGFSIRLRPEQKDALIEKMRNSGFPSFKLWPEGTRNEYHSIIYLQPLDRRNETAIGYDMATDPVRRAAMETARDKGMAAASGKVTLVQEIDAIKQAGFLIYAPVYRRGLPATTEKQRREALLGFVYSPFRVEDFFTETLANKKYDVSFQVYDSSVSPENLLHDSSASSAQQAASYEPHFVASTTMEIAGRTWILNYASSPEFDLVSSRVYVPYTFVAGLFVSFLFFTVARSQARARAAAEHSSVELMASEAKARETLEKHQLAEQALRESEERYRELVENANDIVYTLDFDGKLSSVNKAGELITGYSREELLNRSIAELLTPESGEASRKMLERKLEGQLRTNYEVDLISKSGRILTLEVSSRLLSRDGQPVAVHGVARDITARRLAEEVLRQADQRALSEYERLLERISSLAQALGTSRELLSIFRALRGFTQASVPCDGLFVSLYDSARDVRTACYAWGDGVEIDTSELPPMPITSTGPNSRAVRTGQTVITDDYMSATRPNPGIIIGPDNGLRPQSSLAVPMAVMGRIVGTIEVQSYERAAYRAEHATAMSMAANLTAVAIENVRLLERESSARATAEESNRLKDEFLATVSHELRTPLTAILGWSRMLEAGSLDEEVAERAIETIHRNAKAQSQIIDDILDVSRIITGNLYLELQPIELAPVLEAAINVVRPTADAKSIQIETEFDSQLAVVSGDGNRLQQVIWNLVSNAVKFTQNGGRVRVALHQVDSQVEISVTDNGQGINSDFLPFVFDRFRQADSTTTRQHGGLGLGLAIARHIVEIHGGTIHGTSQGEGTGATFSVRLPLLDSATKFSYNQEKPPPAESSENQQMPLSGLHVLLVDDDRDTLELMTTALATKNARVTAVGSASEALEAIKLARPDVIVSDIAMPGVDGYQLLQKVRSLDSGAALIPAVAITAYAKEEDRNRALESGFQGYLAKPVELSELVSVVAEAASMVRRSI